MTTPTQSMDHANRLAFELDYETNTMQAAFQLIARNDSDSESGSDASESDP